VQPDDGCPGRRARVSTPGKSGTGASDNSRCSTDSAGAHIHELRRADRGGTDDRRGVQRRSRNLPRGHVRAGRTIGRGTGHASCNRCHHHHEQGRVQRVHSTQVPQLLEELFLGS